MDSSIAPVHVCSSSFIFLVHDCALQNSRHGKTRQKNTARKSTRSRLQLEVDTIRFSARQSPPQRVSMSKKHTYVLGLNTYDHDVSACLLRDGAIAFAIAKERITRDKHASGFYKEVIDYCLQAEGITLDDVDLIVRNCYILPVGEMEERLVYFDAPGFLPEFERERGGQAPVVSFAFGQGRDDLPPSGARLQRVRGVAVRRRRGDDRRRRRQLQVRRHGSLSGERYRDAARARIRELLQIQGIDARMPEEGFDGAGPRLPQRRVLHHAGSRRAL